ncbi:unnamed protein product [Orchesella dallaii]|uniref:Methyl farnesoate epoxidase n=1 Tax=Orchesella dallaii TaxID=48710 RepID=A0ABP1RBH9_9HEXA
MLTLFLCTLIGILFISLILISYFNNHAGGVVKNVKVRPPGPYRFPIVGNLVQLAMINLKEPYLAFRDLSEKYGDVMSIQLGSVYAVMEEYLSKPEFSDRYANAYVMERSFHKQMGIIFAKYPEPCRVLRRFSLRTLREFGFGQRNRMLSVIQNELSEIVHDLKQNKTENKWIHNFDGYFALSFLNVLWSMLAGSRYEHSDPKLQRLIKTVRSMLSAANMSTNILMAYPQFKDWLPGWTGMTALRKWNDEMIAFSSKFIAERRKLGIYKTSPDNVIDEFLREIDAHEGEIDTVYTGILNFKTTNNTLSYCILYLVLNPHVQKRLQEEVDKNVPRGTFPTAEHELE